MLDEIGEMSPGLQAKFLRVLEGHPFERVGGSKPVSVDVRVIAATNRDLEKAVVEGIFRRDLYFRLRVLEIVVPALRKRPEDIPLLADFFLRKFNAETGRKITGFTEQAKEKLITYLWPGNVRELKNVIERAVVLCRGQQIDEGDLLVTKLATAGDTAEAEAAAEEFLPASLEDIERRYILATLEPHDLEQEPHGDHFGDRALDAGPQNPALRAGRAAVSWDAVILRIRGPLRPLAKVAEDDFLPFGTLESVTAAVRVAFPDAQWNKPTYAFCVLDRWTAMMIELCHVESSHSIHVTVSGPGNPVPKLFCTCER